jgi:hypothetical protein
MFVTLITLM